MNTFNIWINYNNINKNNDNNCVNNDDNNNQLLNKYIGLSQYYQKKFM